MGSIPFTEEQFLDVFKAYNESVFPAQIILYLIAGIIVFLIYKKPENASRWVTLLLGAMWTWTGATYHLLFFTDINKGAYLFGALFLIQGLLLFWAAYRKGLSFGYASRTLSFAGWAFIVYAMILYPILGRLFGLDYPAIPTFGLPCPLVIFTFGVLLLTARSFSRWLLVIPSLWALIGSSAFLLFGIYQDIALLLSALVAWPLLIWRDRKA